MLLTKVITLTALLSLLSSAQTAPANQPVVFHVAPGGTLRTIEQARDAVRALKQKQGGALQQPVTVLVHGGTYSLTRPLLFTPEDSGTAAAPVTYAAFGDGVPVLTGGRSISGWKEVTVDGKKLWAAEIPAVREGKWNFHQLFLNGQRRVRARGPNEGSYRMTAVPDLQWGPDYHTGQGRFQCAPGDVKPWKNLTDVEVVVLHFWVSTRIAIASFDESQNMVTLLHPTRFRMSDAFQRQFARYYVENAFELLDSPGEWYLNRKTGMLYYMPMPGEDLKHFEAVAPAVEQFMLLEGDAREGRFVENLTFRGLSFAYADWWLPEDYPTAMQDQGSVLVPAAIWAWSVRNCSFEACAVAHVSTYGIHFSRGCSHNRIVGCELFDLGAGGIKVGEPDRQGKILPDKNGVVHDLQVEETHDIEITDNHIHDGGKIFHQALGVFVSQCYNNLIAHNHIHDLYKNAVSVGWSWQYGKSLARGNVIEYNHIHDIGKGLLSDGGAIYTLGMQPGTVIRYNLMHDSGSTGYGGRGVYLDQASSGIVVENNISYRTSGGGFSQTFGRNNVIRNNIFALGLHAQLEPNGGPTFLKAGNDFIFERNIVYFASDQPLLKTKWNDKEVVLRKNLYWQAGGGEIKFGPETWAQWQARGMDQGSLIADPLFVDPEKGDFRLKPSSPVQKIGFEPFDVSNVGPRKNRLGK